MSAPPATAPTLRRAAHTVFRERHPPAALAASASGAAFIALLLQVHRSHGLAELDVMVRTMMRDDRHRHPTLEAVALAVTVLGNWQVVAVLTAVAMAAFVVRRRDRRYATVLGAAMMLASGLTEVLKRIVARPSPSFVSLAATGHDMHGVSRLAFPSGHAVGVTVLVGVPALAYAVQTRRRWAGAAALTTAALCTALVGSSRVYLGYHWLTDVLAGWALGVAVIACAAPWLRTPQTGSPRPEGDAGAPPPDASTGTLSSSDADNPHRICGALPQPPRSARGTVAVNAEAAFTPP